ncbi:MAG TPA: protein kinase [Candidatus Angelobacter sp.]|nr:protein kinase [Candidatus Angelobacter sp.]
MLDREERLMSLAAEALRTPAADREKFLRAACEQDEDLYTEVTEIVEWEERMGDFLRDPLVSLIDLERLDRPFSPGQTVSGRFQIIREVGNGGMGVVYEAYDGKRGERIAIKCAKPGFDRLSPELNGALNVRHRNMCVVNDIHTASTELGDLQFLTMEFVDGETLLQTLKRGPLLSEQALDLARQLCAGLTEAHRSNVIHGDLKPANIILSPQKDGSTRLVITDFGLAVDMDGNTDLLGGTPSYMAPELKQDGQTSPASDVYALGVILYEMVTGEKPFLQNTDGEIEIQKPLPPSKITKGLPSIWDHTILPCLKPEPEKRPSAQQVLEKLNRKPIYQHAWLYAAALVLVIAGIFTWKPVYEFLRPPDIKLAILPAEGADGLKDNAEKLLNDVAQNLDHLPKSAQKVRVFSPAELRAKGVADLEQAERVLHATHVLEVRANHDGNEISVNAALIKAGEKAPIREYAGDFTASDLHDLPGGLEGLVSTTLHLPHATPPIAPAATTAYNSGLNYLRQGRYNYDEAITQFNEAKRLDPDSALPYAGLAEAHVLKSSILGSKKELDEAEANVRQGEKLDSDAPQIHIASSIVNTMRGRYAQAKQECTRALEIEPQNADAWVDCGFADEMQGISDKALEEYQKAEASDPTYFKPYQFIGGFYNFRGQYAEAEPFYRKEVKYAVNDPDAFGDLGGSLTEQAKFIEAKQVYTTALKIKKIPTSLNNMGATLAYEGRDAEALALYREAVKLEPANFRYWMNIGDSERRLGHGKAAATAYQKLVELTQAQLQTNAASASARAFYAYGLARLGRKADAEREIGQAVQSTTDNQLLRHAVFTYEALGERDHALEIASRLTPASRKILQHHPDLADFSQDSRFKQMLANSH